MMMGDIQYYVPPRPSGDITGVSLGEWVEPLQILIAFSIAASFVILMSGSFYPCIIKIGWFVFVSAVGIDVAVIASMFGTVVNDLIPFVSIAVFLHDLL